MRTTARVAAALMTTTVLIGGTATAASAQATSVKDKASDVVSYADENDARGTVLGYADSISSGVDVRTVQVKHTKKSVSIKVKFAELAPTTLVSVEFRPNNKSRSNRYLVTLGGRKAEVYNTKDKKVCSAKATTRTGAKGSINVVIKRSCLGSPQKIRASVVALRYEPDTGTYLIDTVSKSSVRTPTYTKSLKAS